MAAPHYADAVEQGCRALWFAFVVFTAASLIGAGIGIWTALR
jgi:hypothetical protein